MEKKKLSYKQKQRLKITGCIQNLFSKAERIKNRDQIFTSQCVHLARKLSSKAKVPIPRELKRRFCKYCDTYFIPGRNYRVRTTGKTITYTCKSCGKWTRVGYKNNKNE